MINPIAHLLFIVVFWLAFATAGKKRADLTLTLGGVAFLAVYAPIALFWIAFTTAEACLLVLWLRNRERSNGKRQYLPYILLPNLLFVELHPAILLISVETLAISFSIIRIFMTAKQLLAMRKPCMPKDVYWIWAAAFFLPALIVGPVFSGTELRKQAKQNAQPDCSARTFRFLLTGIVTVLLINPMLTSFAHKISGLPWTFDLGIEGAPIYFAILYTGFYGQSLIAEHTSRLFGRTLPVNFAQPWRAANIRDFWQRWHRSMANFVMQYVFLPLNLRGVSARLATIASFCFMGLWHNLSPGYLLWGICHGSLLAFWPKDLKWPLARALERVVTWVAVILLSYLANYSWLA